MNIGERYGVKTGQYFQVKDEDIVFEVIAVESDSCSLTPVKSNQKATKGWKLYQKTDVINSSI